jgi:hypothetical protein
MRRSEDGNRHLDRKSCQKQLEVTDLDVAEPPDVTSNKDGNH